MSVSPINLSKLRSDFAQLERLGIPYGYGAKAEGSKNPNTGEKYNSRSNGHLSTDPSTLDHLDCSGFIRYILYRASGGALVLPDGSQNQRGWCEGQANGGEMHSVARYQDANTYMTPNRLFIAFIKPHTNGCGPIGHVWLLSQLDDQAPADTLESYGSHGVGSRPWNASVLRSEVYSVFELPVV